MASKKMVLARDAEGNEFSTRADWPLAEGCSLVDVSEAPVEPEGQPVEVVPVLASQDETGDGDAEDGEQGEEQDALAFDSEPEAD